MDHGPTAHRVAGNIRELRRERELDLAGLSALLTQLGHAIGLNTLSKIERGTRRVDVDDLVALAFALDVTPNRLILTGTADARIIVLTGDTQITTASAWEWATGNMMLPRDPVENDETHEIDLDRVAQFARDNRPHEPPDTTFADLHGHQQQLATVMDAVIQAEKAGVPWRAIRDWLDFQDTIQLARRTVEKRDHQDGEQNHGQH